MLLFNQITIQINIMKKKQFWQVVFIFLLLFPLFYSYNASAQSANEIFFINLDKKTIARGYTVVAFADKIKLSLIPGILDESTGVDVVELHEALDEPWQFDRVSEVYQFEFRNKLAYDNHKPFIIQIKYDSQDNNLKQVYYFDKNFNAWRPLPTKDYSQEKMVRAYIHLPFARVAVFSNPEIMSVGGASWYAYQGGDFAASPDFPKGSILNITNIENGLSVKVEVNDWGPDRSLHPDRVIDLDKVAFQKIASLRDGIINVDIEPVYIPEQNGRVLGINIANTVSEPQVSSRGAIISDVDNDEILFAKNATTTMPLASLTKIMTASVFLDTNPDFNKVVAYSNKDDEITWQHVDKNESARLRIADGDELTVNDLFLSTLMASTNNTAETLVRISGLSRTEFIQKMNDKARFWGANSTNFIEPTGLAPENVSTPADYVIITKNALQNSIIAQAITTKEYRFETLKEKNKKILKNTNNLLYSDFHITGGKTGYLDEAGYCLMTGIKTSDNRHLIGVIFGAPTRAVSFDELSDLLKYASRKL